MADRRQRQRRARRHDDPPDDAAYWHGSRRPALCTLDLSHGAIGPRGWRALRVALSNAPTLKFLGLEGQSAVNTMPPPGAAETLGVSNCGLSGELVVSPGVRRLAAANNDRLRAVAPLPGSLEALEVSQSRGLPALPPALPQGLRELRLGGFRATVPPLPAGLQVLDLARCLNLSELPPFLPPNLRELRLCDSCHLRLQPLSRLEVLDLSHCSVKALPEPLLDPAGFPVLQELHVRTAWALPNAAGLYLPSLRKLVLGVISGDTVALPRRLHEFTALTELQVHHGGRQAILPPRLKSLQLWFCDEWQALPQLPAGLVTLVVLDAPHVASVELPRGLQGLRLYKCPFAAHITDFPAGLRWLHLFCIPGGGVGLTTRLERLERLELQRCGLTALPEDMAGLFPALRVLNVTGNPELRLSADNGPNRRLEQLKVDNHVEVPMGAWAALRVKPY